MSLLITIIVLVFAVLARTNFRQAVILVAALLPTYVIKSSLFGLPTNVLELLILTLFIVGFLRTDIRKEWLTNIRRLPKFFLASVCVFIGTALVSTIISHEIRNSLGVLKGWIIIPVLYGFVVFTQARTATVKISIITALIWSGVIVSLIGLWQLPFLPRVTSVYDVPNSLALFIAPLTAMSFWLGRYKQSRFFMVSAGIMALVLLATQSLGGVLSVVASIVLSNFIFKRKLLSIRMTYGSVIIMFVLVTGVFWLNGKIPYLLSSIHNPAKATSATVRLQLWSISWQLIKEHPLLGVGLNQFEPNYQRILHERFATQSRKVGNQVPLSEFVFRDPHNFLLSFWLNMGIAGLLAFIALNWLALSEAVKQKGNVENQALALALIATLIFGLTDTVYWKNDLAVTYWMVIILLISNY